MTGFRRKLLMANQKFPYLVSNGQTYIDTGVKATSNLNIHICGKLNVKKTYDYFIGAYDNANKFILQSRNFYADLYYGTSSFEFKDSALENAIYTLKDNIVKIYGTANNSFLDSFSAQNFSMNYNLYLFALNNTGTVEYGENDKSEMQIRYCKIWDGDTLVRDFVPAIDNGIVCMYDNITKAYFYPIGDELSLNYE